MKLFDARHAVTPMFKMLVVVMNHNTAKTLRPMFVNTFSKDKVNTRCYRFNSWGCDGLSLGVYFEPFTRTEVTIFSRSNCQN
jgi:hypothetical protein